MAPPPTRLKIIKNHATPSGMLTQTPTPNHLKSRPFSTKKGDRGLDRTQAALTLVSPLSIVWRRLPIPQSSRLSSSLVVGLLTGHEDEGESPVPGRWAAASSAISGRLLLTPRCEQEIASGHCCVRLIVEIGPLYILSNWCS